jgi:hypothetical protein
MSLSPDAQSHFKALAAAGTPTGAVGGHNPNFRSALSGAASAALHPDGQDSHLLSPLGPFSPGLQAIVRPGLPAQTAGRGAAQGLFLSPKLGYAATSHNATLHRPQQQQSQQQQSQRASPLRRSAAPASPPDAAQANLQGYIGALLPSLDILNQSVRASGHRSHPAAQPAPAKASSQLQPTQTSAGTGSPNAGPRRVSTQAPATSPTPPLRPQPLQQLPTAALSSEFVQDEAADLAVELAVARLNEASRKLALARSGLLSPEGLAAYDANDGSSTESDAPRGTAVRSQYGATVDDASDSEEEDETDDDTEDEEASSPDQRRHGSKKPLTPQQLNLLRKTLLATASPAALLEATATMAVVSATGTASAGPAGKNFGSPLPGASSGSASDLRRSAGRSRLPNESAMDAYATMSLEYPHKGSNLSAAAAAAAAASAASAASALAASLKNDVGTRAVVSAVTAAERRGELRDKASVSPAPVIPSPPPAPRLPTAAARPPFAGPPAPSARDALSTLLDSAAKVSPDVLPDRVAAIQTSGSSSGVSAANVADFATSLLAGSSSDAVASRVENQLTALLDARFKEFHARQVSGEDDDEL